MLKVLRDNLKYLSWILWLVIAVFIAFVFVDFGAARGGRTQTAGAAATVGDSFVSYKDLQRQYRRLEQQYREAFGDQFNSELADQLRLPAVALEQLVGQKLIAEEARRQGLRATDDEVRSYILSIPGIRDDSGKYVGDPTYKRFLRANEFTAREFEEAVREEIVSNKLRQTFLASVAVPDDAVERAWRERHENASIRYVLAPAGRYAAAAKVGDEELATWFAEHRERFRFPDRRIVDYLLVDSAALRASLEIPEEDLRRYYDDHADEYSRPEQVHARHILVKIDESRDAAQAEARMAEIQSRLDAGEPFEKVAAEFSDDPGSRDRGGDVGWFGRGQMVPEFEQAAFGATPGSRVGPVKTSFGLHLIDVLERRNAGRQPFEEVQATIRARLAGERADAAAETRARDLVARLEAGDPANEATWTALADDQVVTFTTTPPFGREDTVPGIGRNPAFVDAAFALAPGAVSEPVRLPRGWAILRLREEQPAHLPELAEVESRARAELERERSLDLAADALEEASRKIAGGESFDDAAAGLGLEVAESGEFTRSGSIPGLGAAAPIADVAFGLDPGQVGGPVRVGSGAVLFQVVARTPFDPAAFAADRDDTLDQLRQEKADRLLASLLSERRKQVGVTYDPGLEAKLGLGGGNPNGG